MNVNDLRANTQQTGEGKIHQHIRNVFETEFRDDVITGVFYSLPFHECVEETLTGYKPDGKDMSEIKRGILDGLLQACIDLRELMVKDGYSTHDAIIITNRIREALSS